MGKEERSKERGKEWENYGPGLTKRLFRFLMLIYQNPDPDEQKRVCVPKKQQNLVS